MVQFDFPFSRVFLLEVGTEGVLEGTSLCTGYERSRNVFLCVVHMCDDLLWKTQLYLKDRQYIFELHLFHDL